MSCERERVREEVDGADEDEDDEEAEEDEEAADSEGECEGEGGARGVSASICACCSRCVRTCFSSTSSCARVSRSFFSPSLTAEVVAAAVVSCVFFVVRLREVFGLASASDSLFSDLSDCFSLFCSGFSSSSLCACDRVRRRVLVLVVPAASVLSVVAESVCWGFTCERVRLPVAGVVVVVVVSVLSVVRVERRVRDRERGGSEGGVGAV